MTSIIGHQVLLPTKHHRPRTTADLVHRPRLKQLPKSGLDRPMILVAAPAGFGNSTLLSARLGASGLPRAWISLDDAVATSTADRFAWAQVMRAPARAVELLAALAVKSHSKVLTAMKVSSWQRPP